MGCVSVWKEVAVTRRLETLKQGQAILIIQPNLLRGIHLRVFATTSS